MKRTKSLYSTLAGSMEDIAERTRRRISRRLIPFLAAGFERIAQVGGTQPLPRVTAVRKKNK